MICRFNDAILLVIPYYSHSKIMGTLRLPLLVLIWRTLTVLGDSCTSAKIDYLPSPLPVYKIEHSVKVDVYTCEVYRRFNDTNIIFYDKKDPINEIVSMCLQPSSNPNNNTSLVEVRCDKFGELETSVFCQMKHKQHQHIGSIRLSRSMNIIANIDGNKITIENYICRYSLGTCTITDNYGDDKIFVWKVVYPEFNPCDRNSFYQIRYQWIGNFENGSSNYIAIRDIFNKRNMYSLELLASKEAPCGTIWRTSAKGTIVFDRELDTSSIKFSKNALKPLNALCYSEESTCDCKSVSEPENVYDHLSLFHLLILLYIAGKVFNVLLNYCTLRKLHLKKKKASKMYIFYCLMQSLTNRCIYFCQENVDEPACTINTARDSIRNTSGNELDAEGYLKPTARNVQATGYSTNKTNNYDYIKKYDESSSHEYLTYSKPNHRKPMHEIYSYAYE